MSKIYHEGAFLAQNSYYMADFCVATLSISSANKCGYTLILADLCVATLQFHLEKCVATQNLTTSI